MNLIERLEALEAPCRECEAAVFRTLAGNPTDHWYEWGGLHLTDDTAPPVIESMDAVMALIPKGWRLHSLIDQRAGSKPKTCWLVGENEGQYASGEAILFTAALCIAALRAQETANGR